MDFKSARKILIAAILFAITSCQDRQSDPYVCQFKEIKTLYFDQNMHVGVDTAYGYTVLLREFSRSCMDSATIINIARKYMDTVNGARPINVISFYSSDEDFIPYEHSQVMQEIDKSCLVKIGFDDKSGKPEDFVFYNERGDIIYWGERWVPFPKGKDIYRLNVETK